MFGIDETTPADLRRRSRSGFLRGLKLTLVFAGAAWLAATTTARAQTDFAFSNVSAVLNGTPISINGSFTVEGPFEYIANIGVMAGPPYGGGYSCASCYNGTYFIPLGVSPNSVVAEGPGGSLIQIGFANNSSTIGGTVPITSVAITSNGTTVTDSAPTGVAVVTGHAVDYTFSNASTVLNGTPESITGSFVFDPLTLIEYIAFVQFTGPAPYSGELYYDTEQGYFGDLINLTGPGPGDTRIDFANNLSSGTDPLASVNIYYGPSTVTDPAPTGFVCAGADGVSCPATAPEPTSLAILGAALGLFLLSPRVSRRAGQPRHPRAPDLARAPVFVGQRPASEHFC